MTDPRTDMDLRPDPPTRRSHERGQIILLFAGAMVVILAMAGLLIDGGFLLSSQRQAQAAADTGALAAAQAAATGGNVVTAARTIALDNGYADPLVDCDGASLADQGVDVNRPPLSGPFQGQSNYVEVITSRAERTFFAKALGMPCFVVRARAVAQIGAAEVATCNFCVLTEWAGDGSDNPFLMDNTGHLRVDGDILVNGKAITGPCTPSGAYLVCGKALHLYRTGGTPGDVTHLSARTIAVAGGWESLGGTQAQADALAEVGGSPCPWHPDPNSYAGAGYPTANVCVGMPPIDDPFNDPDDPLNLTGARIDPPDASLLSAPQVGVSGCPSDNYETDYPNVVVPTGTLASPDKLNLSGTTAGGPSFTICPGLYFGGFSVVGDFRNVRVKMMPGTYFMVGGGFQVGGTASIYGDGVTIYSSGGTQSFSHNTPARDPDLVPDCDPLTSACNVLTAVLAGATNTNVENPVTYTLTLTAPTSPPGLVAPVGGTVDFYDGADLITTPNCEDVALVPVASQPRRATATCTITYTEFGTRWITAEYSGDDIFAPVAANKSTNINPNANLGIDDIDICTGGACGASAPCTLGGPCTVVLHAPTTGDYAGLLIFQDRTSSLGLRFWPHFGLPACTGDWMTDGVPTGPNPGAAVPDPCGPLGGLSGTIYAPKVRTGGGQWDATVNLRADGVANLQIVAGRIALQYNTDARFAFRPEEFANGAIRLVE